MSNFSIKQILISIFLVIGLLVTTLVAYVIPSQIDSELTQRLDSDLLPALRTDMGELSQKVRVQLEGMKQDGLKRAKVAFEREKTAIANRLVATMLPMAETFDLDGIQTLASNEITNTPGLTGLKVSSEKNGSWSDFGSPIADASHQIFREEAKSDFAYVAVEMFVSTSELEQALQHEEDAFAAIITNINDASAEMLEETETGIGVLQEQMSDGVHNRINILAIGTIVALLCVTFLCLLLLDRVAIRPLRSAVDTLNEIAEGNLQVQIKVNGKNEVSKLLTAMKLMAKNLSSQIHQISSSTVELSNASHQMTNITDQTQEGVKRQQTETGQVATAITEMIATLKDVASNTTAAVDAARHADDESKNGQQEVSRTINSINGLAEEVQKASDVISRLEENADAIGTVLDVIRSIADQTNLLALNAAIEAARAGEAGRGFTVVADEVRSLATRTQQSTAEIHTIIEQLQQDARGAVKVMREGCEKANDSVVQAAAAGAALESMGQAVTTITDMNTQIASASEEQTMVAEEINRSIANISQVTNDTATGAEQIGASADELTGLVSRLQGLVKQYKF